MVAINTNNALTKEAFGTTPWEMAVVLFNASASSAPAYALAAQNDAVERRDGRRVAFWQDVRRDLESLRDRLDAPLSRENV